MEKLRLEFKVGDINSILSDHCPIMATLHLDKAIRHEQDQTVKMLNLPDRFIWDTDSTGTFLETLKSEEYKTKGRRFTRKRGSRG